MIPENCQKEDGLKKGGSYALPIRSLAAHEFENLIAEATAAVCKQQLHHDSKAPPSNTYPVTPFLPPPNLHH